ncbi:hypothetical protein BJV89_004358 [Clostridium beijerinckii]|uniref:hypothetical protein n=1 Tax=Clostridium beijerinckii TaxID=1520 RepID=UPI003BF53420|nr:hypothetical protein [Clostridium beijerinckii]
MYIGDAVAYNESLEILKQLFNKELGKDEQVKLLEDIKEIHGRKSPNVSKKSHGLNAWLKFLDIQCEWIENPNSDWSTLIIKDLYQGIIIKYFLRTSRFSYFMETYFSIIFIIFYVLIKNRIQLEVICSVFYF